MHKIEAFLKEHAKGVYDWHIQEIEKAIEKSIAEQRELQDIALEIVKDEAYRQGHDEGSEEAIKNEAAELRRHYELGRKLKGEKE